jgi:hypothetical protein
VEKGISYLNRTFNDYRDSLMGFTKQYYPELVNEFNDASVGSWMLDVVASIADNLSYHIDRVYQETNLDSASEKSSVYAMARNNGIKIPGPTASMAEVKFTCELPLIIKSGDKGPDWSYAPIIKRGTKVSSGNQIFELLNDINFAEQFNEDGISNRTIMPKQNSNKYVITKTGIVSAGETKVYTKTIKSSDITPFMSFIIPDTDVMNVESIIFKDGVNHTCSPSMLEFMYPNEIYSGTNKNKMWRFFEVDYLAQQYKWDDVIVDGKPEKVTVTETINGVDTHLSTCTKGEWKPLRQKFITEFTDKGYLKVIFGAGDMSGMKMSNETDMSTNSKYIISHMVNNDGLGVLPNANTTMYVMYRRGGGATSNIAEGAITNINYLNMSLSGANSSYVTEVKRSLSVTNTSPSVSGKDMPSTNEIKNLIKYNNGAQNRCVTVKDYHSRILQMPPRYGCPFRVGVSEENNKIMVYLLGLDANGKLTDVLPDVLCKNIMNYLSEYCMVNDFVEIKSGRIIDLQFEVDLFVDKNYNTSDVVSNVINTISNYMNINNRDMGTNIFVGDIEKEISKVDGVENLIELRVYNIYGNGYSQTRTSQQTMTYDDCASNSEDGDSGEEENRSRIDLKASDKTLYCENETMLEIKNEKTDIICRVKTR